jgi:hypothetical protein
MEARKTLQNGHFLKHGGRGKTLVKDGAADIMSAISSAMRSGW